MTVMRFMVKSFPHRARFQLCFADVAGADNFDFVGADLDDGRAGSGGQLAAVDKDIDLAGKILFCFVKRPRRRFARRIGAGRRQGMAECFDNLCGNRLAR